MAKYQVVTKKGLGQNFLADANILRKIVNAAELTAADVVWRLVPGLVH